MVNHSKLQERQNQSCGQKVFYISVKHASDTLQFAHVAILYSTNIKANGPECIRIRLFKENSSVISESSSGKVLICCKEVNVTPAAKLKLIGKIEIDIS